MSREKEIEQQLAAAQALKYRQMPDAEVHYLGLQLKELIPYGPYAYMPPGQPQRAFKWAVSVLTQPKPFDDVVLGDARWSQEDWDMLNKMKARYELPAKHERWISRAILYQVVNLLRERLGPDAQLRSIT